MTNVQALARDWLDAKRAENAANAARIKIETQLAEALDVPSEGSKTHKIDGYKITLTQPVTRKLDVDAWAKVEQHCPISQRPVKVKLEADATGCKWLAENEPSVWRKIAAAFETKPGKIGVRIEETE
jgi:hypothetical protein